MTVKCACINFSKELYNQFLHLLAHQKKTFICDAFDDYSEFVKFKENLTIDLLFICIDHTNTNIFVELKNTIFSGGIIFISNRKVFAYEALKIGAIDYLLKPINEVKFAHTQKKINLFIKSRNKVQNHPEENFIYVKSNFKNIKVYTKSINWIQALGDYVKIICEDHTFVVLSTMKVFEEKLSDASFLRIHKSYIVNLKKIEHFTTKNVTIKTHNIPLSRTKKSLLHAALKV